MMGIDRTACFFPDMLRRSHFSVETHLMSLLLQKVARWLLVAVQSLAGATGGSREKKRSDMLHCRLGLPCVREHWHAQRHQHLIRASMRKQYDIMTQ